MKHRYKVGVGDADPMAIEVEAGAPAHAEVLYVARYALLARPDGLKAVPVAEGDAVEAQSPAATPAPPPAAPPAPGPVARPKRITEG